MPACQCRSRNFKKMLHREDFVVDPRFLDTFMTHTYPRSQFVPYEYTKILVVGPSAFRLNLISLLTFPFQTNLEFQDIGYFPLSKLFCSIHYSSNSMFRFIFKRDCIPALAVLLLAALLLPSAQGSTTCASRFSDCLNRCCLGGCGPAALLQVCQGSCRDAMRSCNENSESSSNDNEVGFNETFAPSPTPDGGQEQIENEQQDGPSSFRFTYSALNDNGRQCTQDFCMQAFQTDGALCVRSTEGSDQDQTERSVIFHPDFEDPRICNLMIPSGSVRCSQSCTASSSDEIRVGLVVGVLIGVVAFISLLVWGIVRCCCCSRGQKNMHNISTIKQSKAIEKKYAQVVGIKVTTVENRPDGTKVISEQITRPDGSVTINNTVAQASVDSAPDDLEIGVVKGGVVPLPGRRESHGIAAPRIPERNQ